VQQQFLIRRKSARGKPWSSGKKQAPSYLLYREPNRYHSQQWKQAVVSSLSVQQRRRMEQQKIESLVSLDLAALLRVFDQNGYQISSKLDLTPEARHDECQSPG